MFNPWVPQQRWGPLTGESGHIPVVCDEHIGRLLQLRRVWQQALLPLSFRQLLVTRPSRVHQPFVHHIHLDRINILPFDDLGRRDTVLIKSYHMCAWNICFVASLLREEFMLACSGK